MAHDSGGSAEEAVAATTLSYGGPASDKQLAEVYLPEGQDEVQDGDTAPKTDDTSNDAVATAGAQGAGDPAGEPPD